MAAPIETSALLDQGSFDHLAICTSRSARWLSSTDLTEYEASINRVADRLLRRLSAKWTLLEQSPLQYEGVKGTFLLSSRYDSLGADAERTISLFQTLWRSEQLEYGDPGVARGIFFKESDANELLRHFPRCQEGTKKNLNSYLGSVLVDLGSTLRNQLKVMGEGRFAVKVTVDKPSRWRNRRPCIKLTLDRVAQRIFFNRR